MKYISLDIESTSLEQSEDNIIQLSMVLEDTNDIKPIEELPHFTCFIKKYELTGQPFALAMNAWILDYISGRKENPPYPIYEKNEAFDKAKEWIESHFDLQDYKPSLAGKNVATFDFQFLPNKLQRCFSRRFVDPGPIFIDWKNDRNPPGLTDCLRRAGIMKYVSHDALDDARDVIRVLRSLYA